MDRQGVFVSYCFDDEDLVGEVNARLACQPLVHTFYYPEHMRGVAYADDVERFLRETCTTFVLFVGERVGKTQRAEALKAGTCGNISNCIVVLLPSVRNADLAAHLSIDMDPYIRQDPIRMETAEDSEKCARAIVKRMGLIWDDLGIPETYSFEYEKDIALEYLKGKGRVSYEWRGKGCPETWPDVERLHSTRMNPVGPDLIGAFGDCEECTGANGAIQLRDKDPRVIVAALSDYHDLDAGACPLHMQLTFAEARPRRNHYFPRKQDNLTIGILVAGGISPGLNALIAGIISRHILYFDALPRNNASLTVRCYREGFNSLINSQGIGPDYQSYTLTRVPHHNDDRQALLDLCQKAYSGGTAIPTARTDALMDISSRRGVFGNIVRALMRDGIELLYVIGGDGSMKAAHGIHNMAKAMNSELAVVAVPKTMDNDILWVWQSFGFPSAVEWAKDAVSHLHTEVTSNPRLCVIQLFGSDSGFVVCHAALASGLCDLVLIPEVDFEIEPLKEYVKNVLRPRHAPGINGKSPYGIILMSETAMPCSFREHLNDPKQGVALDDPDYELTEAEKESVRAFFTNNRRVRGQTKDELRRAGLKIVVGAARKAIRELGAADPYWNNFRVFTNEPRHLLRAIPPSASDILFARRLGSLAVDGAMAGYRDFMISQWLTEYVMVPLSLVVLGRKRVPRTGIFWKSVRASTGQPSDMTQ